MDATGPEDLLNQMQEMMMKNMDGNKGGMNEEVFKIGGGETHANGAPNTFGSTFTTTTTTVNGIKTVTTTVNGNSTNVQCPISSSNIITGSNSSYAPGNYDSTHRYDR